MNMLIEMIENADLLKGNVPNPDVVASMPISDILDLADQSADLTQPRELLLNSTFSHTASTELGGGRSPCASLNCRAKQATELAQFSALYSDRVYINNFLASPFIQHGLSESDFRKSYFDDLVIIGILRPLIQAGRIVLITPRKNICLRCSVEEVLHGDPDKKFDRAYSHFLERYKNEVVFSIEKDARRTSLVARTESNLMDHDQIRIIDGRFAKEIFRGQPELRKQANKGQEVILPPSVVERIGLSESFAHGLFENIEFELSTSQCLRTGLLTSNSLDIEILEQLSADIRLQKRNKIVRELLTSVVPFVQEMSPDELIRLREAEGDSFVLFQAALAKAAENVKQEGKAIDKKDAETLYSDVIAPELARLNIAVTKARRGMVNSARRNVTGWVAAITFGVYQGLLPAGLRETAMALGLTKVLAELSTKLMNDSDAEESIRSENMYFLWKVKQLAEK